MSQNNIIPIDWWIMVQWLEARQTFENSNTLEDWEAYQRFGRRCERVLGVYLIEEVWARATNGAPAAKRFKRPLPEHLTSRIHAELEEFFAEEAAMLDAWSGGEGEEFKRELEGLPIEEFKETYSEILIWWESHKVSGHGGRK